MTTTANELVYDRLIKHQIYLRQYSGHLRNKIDKLLTSNLKDLTKSLEGGSATERPLTEWGRARKEKLLRNIQSIRAVGFKKVQEDLSNDLVDFANHEMDYTIDLFNKASPAKLTMTVLPPEQLKSIVVSRPFNGLRLENWIDNIEKADVKRLKTTLQLGVAQGENLRTIVNRLQAGEAIFYKVGSQMSPQGWVVTRRNLEYIIRTATNHISNRVRSDIAKSNKDIFEEEMFVSTLDIRTTLECASLDGKKFKIGAGKIPPLHINCRSLRVPFLDDKKIGERPAVEHSRKQALKEFSGSSKVTSIKDLNTSEVGAFHRFERDYKRKMTGRVPHSKKFEPWLKETSKDFQDEYLGLERAKLFRSGKYTLKDFVDNKDVLTLEELKRKG